MVENRVLEVEIERLIQPGCRSGFQNDDCYRWYKKGNKYSECVSLYLSLHCNGVGQNHPHQDREEEENLGKNEWTLLTALLLFSTSKKQTYDMSLHLRMEAQCSYKFSTRTIFHCLRSRKCTQLQTRTINLFPTPLKLVTNWVRTSTGKTCGMSKEIKSRTQLKPIAW